MSLDLEQRLRVFLASAPQNRYQVPTLQISHSAMSKTYHLWRESISGTATLETGAVVALQAANFEVDMAGSPVHLDQEFTINLSLADIADEFREQMDRIPVDTQEKIKLMIREYMSDDMTAPQAVATLQVESVSYKAGSASISAVSPRLNVTRTGELYSPREIPMLRGFV